MKIEIRIDCIPDDGGPEQTMRIKTSTPDPGKGLETGEILDLLLGSYLAARVWLSPAMNDLAMRSVEAFG